MLGFIFKRVLLLIPIFIGLTLSTFTLVRMVPGDIVQVLMGERMVDPELHAAAMKRLGLDQPLPIQYVLVKLRRTLLSENFHTPMGSSHCWLYAAV